MMHIILTVYKYIMCIIGLGVCVCARVRMHVHMNVVTLGISNSKGSHSIRVIDHAPR